MAHWFKAALLFLIPHHSLFTNSAVEYALSTLSIA